MKTVFLKDLSPGMHVGMDVYNIQNQLILPKDTVLTTDIIERIQTYDIPYVKITVEEEETINPNLSYLERLKRTKKFKEFRREFLQNIAGIEDEFNDVVTKHTPLKADKLLERTASLFSKTDGTNIFGMLRNMRDYDDSTYVHCLNVSLLCNVMGQWLNFSESDLETLVLAGLLHDIGKLTIPDSIIKKPGKLTKEEFDIIKTHPIKGFEILRDQSLPEPVKYAALMHHERCDGSGYPYGLPYEKINRFARLVSIADVYDAMTATRVYRNSLSPFTVVDVFQNEGLQKYDPECILVFLEHIVDTYLNNKVLLSNGHVGEIVLINKQALSRPLIRLEDNEFVDLTAYKELTIEKIL